LVVYHLIKGLQEQGHEPILFGPADSSVDCPIVPIVDKAVFYPNDPLKVPAFRKFAKAVEADTTRLLWQHLDEIDVIHSHGFDLLDFADFPHVFTLHNLFLMDANDFYFNPLTIDFFEKRRQLNYVSISYNQREGSPDLNYIANVYNGEDTDKFPFVENPDDYVCFLGRFDKDKSPHLAVQLAIMNNTRIKIAGKTDFEGREYFEEEIKPYLKHPLVEYLGELGFDDKVDLLSKPKCNLHPTNFREPFGLTVVEAAYCGTPTLAIERGSMSELIKNEATGMLVEDFMEGFWALDKCFEMDRKYIAERSRRKFNYTRMTKGYIRAYRKAIKLAA